MRVTKIICDRCEEEIKDLPVRLVPVCTDWKTGEILSKEDSPMESEQGKKDYCWECTRKIIAYANGKVEK